MDDRLFAKNLKNPQGEVGKVIGKIMNEINAFITRFTYGMLDIKDDETILEIGFGNGKFINELFDNNLNIHYKGIDVSDLMVEEANIINKELVEKGKVELKVGDSREITYWHD